MAKKIIESNQKGSKKKIIIGVIIALLIIGALGGNNNNDNDTSGVAVVTPVVADIEDDNNIQEIEDTDDVFNEAQNDFGVANEDEFLDLVNSKIRGKLGARERYENISINDKNLIIEVFLTQNFVAIQRFSGITDAILEIEDGYEYWDSITIDFGSVGHISKTKADIIENEYGYYFNVNDNDLVK